MRELTMNEVQDVNGGILPVIAYGAYFAAGAVGTFAACFGFAAGAVDGMSERKSN